MGAGLVGPLQLYTANYPVDAWCGEPSDATSLYRLCTEHDREATDGYPQNYGK